MGPVISPAVTLNFNRVLKSSVSSRTDTTGVADPDTQIAEFLDALGLDVKNPLFHSLFSDLFLTTTGTNL